MRVTPSDPTPGELVALQALLDRSTRTASPAVAVSVAYPARQMSAAEFVEFWRSVRLVATATVGASRPAAYRPRPRRALWDDPAAPHLREHRPPA